MGIQESVINMNQNVDNCVADSEHVELRVGHESPPIGKVEAAGAGEVYWRSPQGQPMPAAVQTAVCPGRARNDTELL